ncbi:hypothetical protein G3480_05005 [Thiorhodococcus mannitoliphagus]|uniref:Uncharacterized protein n=1 Tax=Thiorhodococcus mannitoliphagus TaxID=329406 RepID=A0A6P1DNU4_9GAMM|nr:hypothetical protein [Thiorhodococcus mannitoliphagus]NEX19678.1 hypothetical protein [Thiorhodococcus mannitoliphagus]
MKTPQSSTILSSAALVFSVTAIAVQFPPLNGFIASLSGGARVANPAVEPLAVKSVTDLEAAEVDPAESEPDQPLLDTLDEQARRIAMLEKQLSQFERLIRSAGLDAAAPHLRPPPGSDRPLLAQIGEDYATRARFEERRKTLLERSQQMRQRDMDAYGEASYETIADLYRQARPSRGNSTPEQKAAREAALNSLLTDYPEAYSTSVAVAEQALDAAINRDTQGAEAYYQSLVEASSYSEVVTEQGVNAIPTLQTYLARQYVQEGRYDEATAVLDALSLQGDSIILEPNQMGEPSAKSAQDIVTELRDKIAQ